MKTIEQLTNIDKAKIMFDLFRNEIPDLLEYVQHMATKVADSQEELIANWNNPFLSYTQWLKLAEEASATIKRYNKSLQKSGNVFAEQLFGGYLAIFTNHCIEQFSLHKSRSTRFRTAVQLFYTTEILENSKGHEYLVLEIHGGAEYAAICTDQDGNNLVFDNKPAAEAEAADCQNGFIVQL